MSKITNNFKELYEIFKKTHPHLGWEEYSIDIETSFSSQTYILDIYGKY